MTFGRRVFSEESWFMDAHSVGFPNHMNRISSLFDNPRQQSERTEVEDDYDLNPEDGELLRHPVGKFLYKDDYEGLEALSWDEVEL